MHQYTLGAKQLKSRSAEKDSGRILVDIKLTVSQHCTIVAKKVENLLSCIEWCCQQVKGGDPALYSALVTPHLSTESSSEVSSTRDMDTVERVQQRAMGVMKGLKHVSYKERLREMGLFSLEKGKFRGILSLCINNQRRCKEGGGSD
ncbi:hypothetical protein GRJ2_001045600 [Grus japonensis]|uniref:Uncharacterized protein n=1 Tax=Grus japonensis TaxID=30415 RepID=A0ABC9WK11_GRUJA